MYQSIPCFPLFDGLFSLFPHACKYANPRVPDSKECRLSNGSRRVHAFLVFRAIRPPTKLSNLQKERASKARGSSSSGSFGRAALGFRRVECSGVPLPLAEEMVILSTAQQHLPDTLARLNQECVDAISEVVPP